MAAKNYIWLLFALFVMAGCESLEDTYADYVGTSRYLGKCHNVEVVPGWKRLIVTWENHVDPVIEHIKITWTLNNETKEVLLERGTTEYSIQDLENGVYEVSVYSVDKNGKTSLPEILYERPYTSEHENVLSFTTLIDKSFFIGNRLALIFSDWQEDVETASLNYYSGGELKELVLNEEFLTKNNCYLLPDELDPETQVTIKRSGRLKGCDDLIDFDPYELSRTKTFSTEFRLLYKANYGVNMLTEDIVNSTTELHYDYDVTSFEDILNFPNLKKIVLGKHRYLGNKYLDIYKSASTVVEKERSEFAVKVAHDLLDITVDSYNEHYFERGTFDFVNYLGNTSLPERDFLYDENWVCLRTINVPEDASELFDKESTKGWLYKHTFGKAIEIVITVDMQEVKDINGLQILQYDINPADAGSWSKPDTRFLQKEIGIAITEAVEPKDEDWKIPFTSEKQALYHTSGETTILKFPTPQRARHLRFKISEIYTNLGYGAALGKIQVF